MEALIMGLFGLGLLACVLAGWSILYALVFGYLLFFAYGLFKKHSFVHMLKLSWNGIRTIRTILFVFILIGMITAVWRACGTVATLIYAASDALIPGLFLPATFLLNCMMSMLMGTAFGTAATMGVICMSIGTVMGVSPVITGGAILGGAFFGDRCSPMSTSALLVSALTGTNLYDNIRRMLKTALVPFLAACGFYLLWGLGMKGGAGAPDVVNLFPRFFSLSWLTLIPAVLIILLSVFRVGIRWTMGASILTGCVLCLTIQGMPLAALPALLLTGYQASDPALGPLMNGGGIVSMVRVGAIVCLSSAYAGIFQGTGMLDGIKRGTAALAKGTSPYFAACLTAMAAAMVSCNQTLAVTLTHQLCADQMGTKEEAALTLEDTAVVIAPLVPWSIAGAVPLQTIGAPGTSLVAACFLYLLPLWRLALEWRRGRKRTTAENWRRPV
jgi:NhaC family Na+:H+ antiporter